MEEKKTKDIIKRIGRDFDDVLKKIEKKREEKGMVRLSRGRLTNLIVKHITLWKKIEKDLINFKPGEENE